MEPYSVKVKVIKSSITSGKQKNPRKKLFILANLEDSPRDVAERVAAKVFNVEESHEIFLHEYGECDGDPTLTFKAWTSQSITEEDPWFIELRFKHAH